MTNTKLNAGQREILIDLWQELAGVELFSFPEFSCVVGIERTGANMGRFALSLCGASERKFRKSVGRYEVICKFDDGHTLPMFIGEVSLAGLARAIAQTVGRVR